MADASRPYLGRGWGFPPAFDGETLELRMVEEEVDIQESLFILLSTIRGERLMLPDYGAGLHARVFDGTDNTTLTYFKSQVADAILFFEPRIRLEEISIDARESVDGRLLVHLSYFIPSTNSRSNMVYPFYVREGTNLRVI